MKDKINLQKTIGFTFVLTILSISFFSYEKEGACGSINISKSGGAKSHKMGENCMTCHINGGEGEGCFSAAGTVYDSTLTSTVGNGKIDFFTLANGTG